MSSKNMLIFPETSACFLFLYKFYGPLDNVFSEPFQEVFNGTYTFQKAALLKEKTVEGTHEINKKYFIDKLLLPAICLWRIQTRIGRK